MADIVTQGIINGLSQALKGMDPNSPEAKNLLGILAKAQEVATSQETAKTTKETNKKDAGIKKKIADKKAELAIAEARKLDTKGIKSDLTDLRGQLSTKTNLGTIPKIPVDANGKPVISGTPPVGPVAPTPAPKPSGNKITPPVADAVKTAYISSLRETFKTLPKEYKAEIDKLMDSAAKGAWTKETFMAELEKTKWWRTELPSLQKFFIETHDPSNAGAFAEKLQLEKDAVSANLEKLGIVATQVDPLTGKYVDNSKVIEGIAMNSIKYGWTPAQMQQHLGESAQLHFTGGGEVGSAVDNIKRQALLYGVNLDKNYINSIQTSLLDPTDGRDQQYFMNEMKNQAIDLYKPFAESIKAGRSMYEVTNNYRTKMATLLETDASNVTWQDLMGKVIDPLTGNARMESDFIKKVKQDPLWQYTKNAKETYSNTALDLMKQFGFIG